MVSRPRLTLLFGLLSGSFVVAGPLDDDSLTDRETALLDWANQYQSRVRAHRNQIALPEPGEFRQQTMDEKSFLVKGPAGSPGSSHV